MEEIERACCIRGYHIYKDIWEAVVGEELTCERETENTHDRYAVAVKRRGTVIGHLPKYFVVDNISCAQFSDNDGCAKISPTRIFLKLRYIAS